MAEPTTVRIEVWPVAADEAGLWLVSGEDAWRSPLPLPGDSEPHAEVELLLEMNGVDRSEAPLIHSTSWRADGPYVVLTYVAAIRPSSGLARLTYPSARPISLELAEAVGRPPTHGPTEVPTPRYIDVLMHGLRHYAYLLETDATTAEALTGHWRRHLARLQPALARMYDQPHAA